MALNLTMNQLYLTPVKSKKSPISVTLKIEGKEKSKVLFPVLPSGIEITSPWENQSITLEKNGEYAMLGKKKLRSLTIESFFPKNYNKSYVSHGYKSGKMSITPYGYVKKVKAMFGKVCRIVIAGMGINMLCTIENFTYGEDDGSRDVNFTIELREYRTFGKIRVSKKKAKSYSLNKIVKHVSVMYVTKKNDTLKKIAKKILGSASLANKLYKQNKKKLDKVFKKTTKKAKKKKKTSGSGSFTVGRLSGASASGGASAGASGTGGNSSSTLIKNSKLTRKLPKGIKLVYKF